ncbi:integrase arm-type DNA-binding domain-containing protein [Phaeobacter inhibens]|uniref:tyrosine-type recombinase/integrase n=1 Tax=Phaeobacter inhibens TaxID=221822 RepID=UPI0021A64568|nr:site-specific integrase [Phaeobacter inhibens]UWR76654.1 integrase arm-type DNA-binding domain-containing protein [Phaeobacter inhibens]
MPKKVKELSAVAVKNLKYVKRTAPNGNPLPCSHAVGGVAGLMLQITPSGEGKSWLFRTRVGSKRRTMGLGPYPEVGVAEARERAREAKRKVAEGIDPVEERRAVRAKLEAEQKLGRTFDEALDEYVRKKLVELASEKNRKLWENMVRRYASPVVGDIPIREISVRDVIRIAEPIWHSKNETARRVSNRVENILDWAAARGYCHGRDLVVWRATFKNALPQVKKAPRHHPALRVDDATKWFEDVTRRDLISAKALAVLALTAVRSNMLRGAKWEEFDLFRKVWTIPQDRTKMKRSELRVPLSQPVVDILEKLPRSSDLVFPAPRGGQLTDAALSKLMVTIHEDASNPGYVDAKSKRPAKPHGLRSTFRDWAAERTNFNWAAIEKSLEHLTGTDVERAYQRSDLLEKRRILMDAWAAFITDKVGPVVKLHG